MTNYEKFKDDLEKIWRNGQQFGLHNEHPVKCSSITCCEGCRFGENSPCGCADARVGWLDQEYKEDRSKVVIVASYEDIHKSIETALKGCNDRPCSECAYMECDPLGRLCEIDLVAEQIYQDCKPVGYDEVLKTAVPPVWADWMADIIKTLKED